MTANGWDDPRAPQKAGSADFIDARSTHEKVVQQAADDIRDYFPDADGRYVLWPAEQFPASVRVFMAQAWGEGFAAGKEAESDAYWSAGDPGQAANPYRD